MSADHGPGMSSSTAKPDGSASDDVLDAPALPSNRRPWVAVAVAMGGCVAGVFPIFESDLFWHLATGRWMIERGAVPRIDPFRFTSDASPWVDHEWAFQIVVRLAEMAAGLDGLILLRALALGLFTLAIFGNARRAGLDAGLAGIVALGAMLGVRPRFLLRPEIVTLFAILALVTLLERRERARTSRREGIGPLDVAPVALTVVWVNFHGEAMLSPVLTALLLLGAALGSGTGGFRARWREIVGLSALQTAALLATPYGWRLVEVPLGIRRALGALRASNPEWGSALDSPQPYLFGGIATLIALAIAARRRHGGWVAPEIALPVAALAGLALTGVRHQALFFALAAPYAARCLVSLRSDASRDGVHERRAVAVALALAGIVAAWCIAPPASGPFRPRHGSLKWGFGLAPGRFPVHAAERLAETSGLGPLYNEFAHGGYLLWRLYPPRQVFVDGRMELEPSLLVELERARSSPEGWTALLRREGAVGALVRYQPRRLPIVEPDPNGGFRVVGEGTANTILFPSESWQLVDWDDETMLFLAKDETGWPDPPYRFVRPEDTAATVQRAALDPAYHVGAVEELERKLDEQPDCRRARWLLNRIAGAQGDGSPESDAN